MDCKTVEEEGQDKRERQPKESVKGEGSLQVPNEKKRFQCVLQNRVSIPQ